MAEDEVSSSGSDSESGAEENEQERKDIEHIQSQLRISPLSYDLHVQLINALRKAGELESLREAREKMSSIYPLSPAFWMDWIKDERAIATSDAEKSHVESLFKRAIDDYEDVEIWLEHCHFTIGKFTIGSASAVSDTEQALELALAHQGLNVVSGSFLWEVYREFQYVVLSQMDSEGRQEHLQKMDKLFRRQLSVPHVDMDSTLKEYETFIQGEGAGIASPSAGDSPIPSDCLADYRKASDRLAAMMEYENRLQVTGETDILAAWTDYLTWASRPVPAETKRQRKAAAAAAANADRLSQAADVRLSPNEICCLFERAITALCLQPSIWLRYADYLERDLPNDSQRLVRTLARSVRNCPWSFDLWHRYALASEAQVAQEQPSGLPLTTDKVVTNGGPVDYDGQDGSPQTTAVDEAYKKVEAIFETALSAGLPETSFVLRLWLAYCDYQLRRLLSTDRSSTGAWDQRLAALRETFDRAVNHIEKRSGPDADPEASLMRYQAFIEAKHVGDVPRARAIWSRLMQLHGRGSQARFWLAFLQFERDWGNAKHLARVCAMAINSLPGPSADYHRGGCTSDQLDILLRVCGEAGLPVARIRDLEQRVRRLRQPHQAAEENIDEERQALSRAGGAALKPSRQEKRKFSSLSEDDHASSKAKKGKWGELATEATVKSLDRNESFRAPGKAHGEFVEHDLSKESRTVFVSNLSYSVTEDQLRQRFAECGPISSLRLVRDYAGRSKGYAYIEFTELADRSSALCLDRQPVVPTADGDAIDAADAKRRPMFVSPCDPSRCGAAAGIGFRYASGKREPEKLFIRNLDKKVTKSEVEQIFSQYGELVDVRLVTYRNGAPKGHAYVEFASASQASRALVATDGLLVGDKQISVAISEPPMRGSQNSTVAAMAHSGKEQPVEASRFAVPANPAPHSSVAGKPQNMPSQRSQMHPRTQLAFLPRAISRTSNSLEPSSRSGNKVEEVGADRVEAPKSNDDFRRLFTGK